MIMEIVPNHISDVLHITPCQRFSTACHIFSFPHFWAITMLQVALTYANIRNEITNQSYFCEDSSLMGYSISPFFKTTLHFSSVSIPQFQLYVQQYQVSSTVQNFLVMEYIHSYIYSVSPKSKYLPTVMMERHE